MPITSVSEVKIMLQVSGSSKDAQISALLPIVTDFIQGYCNTDFTTSTIGADSYGNTIVSSSTEQVYPDGLKLAAAHMIEYNIYKQHTGNVTSEGIGAYSVGYSNAYPQEIIDMLKPYRHVKFV